MPEPPVRVTVVLTHPVQYFAGWFQHIAARRPDVALTVLYATQPDAEAQGEGFGRAFAWDRPLLEGYEARVLGHASRARIGADRRSPLDVPAIGDHLARTAPDVVVVPGWHAAVYTRAIAECRRRGLPVVYRGDTNLASAPAGLRGVAWKVATRRRLHRYDAWLAVGTAARRYLAAFDVPEPLVLDSPHAVDNAWFGDAAARTSRADVRDALGLPRDAFVVLFAGKLAAVKRPLDAVDAVARLGGGAHLLVAGAGALEDTVRARADAAGVPALFAGFVNQSQMPGMYAAADVVMLPSARETWGLVVNEALASSRPVVVSSGVGCAEDLVQPGGAGEVVPTGDIAALAAALGRVRDHVRAGHDYGPACRARAAEHSFDRATDGLIAAAHRLGRLRAARAAQAGRAPRVVLLGGNMVIAGGLERMTFEVLRDLAAHGAAVHVVVNGWDSTRIVELAEGVGASWSTGQYRYALRRPTSPGAALELVREVLGTSLGLLRDAWRFRPTHVLVPDFVAALRNWPVLAGLRAVGARVVLRVGNAPEPQRFHAWLWRRVVAPVVDVFVANAVFLAREVRATGIAADRVAVVLNAPPAASGTREGAPSRVPGRVVFVGQVIPPKGLDLLLEAVALLAARGVTVTLDVVGDMNGWESPRWAGYRATLTARAAEADLAGRVRFVGHQADVRPWLAHACVHVCPSRPEQREGLASVVLEAKQAGVPSLVTRSGALPELVRHGVDGWVAPEASAAALAEGLASLLADDAACAAMGRAARASLTSFSRDAFRAGWLAQFGMTERPLSTPGTREQVVQ